MILDNNPEIIKFHFHVDVGYNRFSLRFKSFKDEHIYGAGEQFTTLDLKGKIVPVWVSEHQQVMKIAMKLLRWKIKGRPEPDRVTKYKNHQTYCSFSMFTSSKNYGVYVHEDNYGLMVFDDDGFELKFRNVPVSVSLITADTQLELSEKFARLLDIAPQVSSGGPLLIIYAAVTIKDKNEFRATLSTLWIILNSIIFGLNVAEGLFTPHIYLITGIVIGVSILSAFIGKLIAKKMNIEVFKKFTYILLFIAGMSAIL